MPDFRFHDLRHTGNTLAASTGASTKELMARLGHATPAAAMVYLHARADREAHLTAALGEAILRARPEAAPGEHLVGG